MRDRCQKRLLIAQLLFDARRHVVERAREDRQLAAVADVDPGVELAVADARAALFDSLRAIHGLLDPKQRATLAAMLGGAARGAGPYRV